MIMVLVETAQRHGPLGSLQLALHLVVFPAGVRFQRQTAVRPQLPLGAKPMRRLHQRDKQRGEHKPSLMVTDPPNGIELDSEWRDRAGSQWMRTRRGKLHEKKDGGPRRFA